jgi:DNA-binding NarL/FixJ family response regulator
MIRVLIADDHPMVLQGLSAVIAATTDVEVVGQADDGRVALREALGLRPDVVLLDLDLPEVHGIDVTRQLASQLPDTAVLVLTMFEDDSTIAATVAAGAAGYLLKGASGDDIVAAIRAASAGHAVFGPGVVASRLRGWLASPPAAALPFPELTPRERDILDHLAAGYDNAEIGRNLHLSPKTIANNVSTILAKLHMARDAGLGIVEQHQQDTSADPGGRPP